MDTTDDWSETSLAACATGDDAPVDAMDVDVCPGPVPVLSTFAWSPRAMFYRGNRDNEDDYLDAPLEHPQEHDYLSEGTLTQDALGSPLGLDNGTASPYAESEADSSDLNSEVSLDSPLGLDEAAAFPSYPESEPEDSEDEGDDEDEHAALEPPFVGFLSALDENGAETPRAGDYLETCCCRGEKKRDSTYGDRVESARTVKNTRHEQSNELRDVDTDVGGHAGVVLLSYLKKRGCEKSEQQGDAIM